MLDNLGSPLSRDSSIVDSQLPADLDLDIVLPKTLVEVRISVLPHAFSCHLNHLFPQRVFLLQQTQLCLSVRIPTVQHHQRILGVLFQQRFREKAGKALERRSEAVGGALERGGPGVE